MYVCLGNICVGRYVWPRHAYVCPRQVRVSWKHVCPIYIDACPKRVCASCKHMCGNLTFICAYRHMPHTSSRLPTNIAIWRSGVGERPDAFHYSGLCLGSCNAVVFLHSNVGVQVSMVCLRVGRLILPNVANFANKSNHTPPPTFLRPMFILPWITFHVLGWFSATCPKGGGLLLITHVCSNVPFATFQINKHIGTHTHPTCCPECRDV